MSDSRRVEGERVYCHQCQHEWDRAQGGLTCPQCEGEFVEILAPGTTSVADPPEVDPEPEPELVQRLPSPYQNPFNNHNPWANAPDPDEGDITTYEFNTRGGRGTFSFSTRTITNRGNVISDPLENLSQSPMQTPFNAFFEELGSQVDAQNDMMLTPHLLQTPFQPPMFGNDPFGFARPPRLAGGFQSGGTFTRDMHGQANIGSMQDLFSMIFSTMQQGPGGIQQQTRQGGAIAPNPFELLGALLNPGNSRHGDTVWSQEAFDRILEQLAEQNAGSTAPGPASEEAIRSLPSRKVDEAMLGNDGKAECSICMDSVEVGTQVTELPCKHWFHRDCVSAWLKEHDTCPHCRKPITNSENNTGRPESSRRRRASRRSSSVASPLAPGARENPISVPDSPSELRQARQRFYGRPESDQERPRSHRQSSSQSEQHRTTRSMSNSNSNNNTNTNNNNSGGGITGWIRSRMNLD